MLLANHCGRRHTHLLELHGIRMGSIGREAPVLS